MSESTKDPLQEAMKDAMRAVEAHEGGGSAHEGGGSGEDDPPEGEVTDPSASPAADALLEAKKELDDVIKKAQSETSELKDKWLRAAADLENYKKRSAREKEDVLKFANERLLKDILPVLDDLDRSLQAVPNTLESQSLSEGVRMVQKKFLSQLEKHGVTTFSSTGQPFDPNQHEAVQQLHSDEVPAGAVAAEARRGFFLNGRLLRPALVVVSLGPKPKDGA
jgi:molecular chaperone GrpE